MTIGADAREGKLPSLDGLRALSIGLVVFGHATATLRPLPSWMHPAEVVLGNGELGVSFFFVISGFLITYLLLKELRATRTISFYNFYVRRVTRIFPAFYVYLVFVSSLSILGFLKLTATDVIMSACFVWNYLPLGTGSWWVAQTWSLSIEEQFYVIWPIALATLGPRTATRAGSARHSVRTSDTSRNLSSISFLPRANSGDAPHTRRHSDVRLPACLDAG